MSAPIILSEGIVDKERNNLCRLIRRGRKSSDRLDSDLIQSFYLSSDCHLRLRILFMDKDGEYHNQTYAHWLLLNLSIVGKFVNAWRRSSELVLSRYYFIPFIKHNLKSASKIITTFEALL